ncbi:aspartic peptidase domain-containing protein [Chaetomidium leptoderma]|uniref:Aspartic peptidase domain-containing protein n=1 Tax=Chaetomidium leptoderma TaxID=669021 RepID=A0AAN6VTM9_9PEZI|nr:aspartic peptidase domain-containing protein [Chaetomidium leptoderma]
MRGIPVKVGTPLQSIVMLPWPDFNNTYIYDEEAYCDPSIIWNNKICEIRRGGYFLETESTSFTKSSDLVAAGGAGQELAVRGSELGVAKLLSTSLGGTDLLSAGSSGNLTSMPLGIPRMRWDNGYSILHALGLGSNSTYLNSLVHAGQIPSRVWSMFWGRTWTGAKTDIDGVLVLGGYDKEKVIGRNMTQLLDYSQETGCWTGMKVTVSDVFVNFRNGTDVSIMPRSSAAQCCIVPQRQLLWEAPDGIVEGFEKATNMESTDLSFGLHWGAKLYNTSADLFDGDITFLLSSGLQVRIPNNQFLTPFVDIDRNGSRQIHPDRTEMLMTGVGDNPSTLGRYFLTAAYLMVDHDASTFTLWQANPSSRSSLVPVVSRPTTNEDCGDRGSEGSEDSSSGGSSGGNSRGDSGGEGLGTDVPSAQPSISTALIAGVVAGGVVFVGALAALIFFLIRRRRRNKPTIAHAVPRDGPAASSDSDDHKMEKTLPPEAPGSLPKPSELRGREYATPREVHGSSSPWANMATLGPTAMTYELDGNGTMRDQRVYSGYMYHAR